LKLILLAALVALVLAVPAAAQGSVTQAPAAVVPASVTRIQGTIDIPVRGEGLFSSGDVFGVINPNCYTLRGDSMRPILSGGAKVCAKPISVALLKAGDIIIAYQCSAKTGPTFTHQVVSLGQDGKGAHVLTKGSNNQYGDVCPVYQDDLVGLVVMVIF
jgi:signal peptidase I